jgi:hypothetical protein
VTFLLTAVTALATGQWSITAFAAGGDGVGAEFARLAQLPLRMLAARAFLLCGGWWYALAGRTSTGVAVLLALVPATCQGSARGGGEGQGQGEREGRGRMVKGCGAM